MESSVEGIIGALQEGVKTATLKEESLFLGSRHFAMTEVVHKYFASSEYPMGRYFSQHPRRGKDLDFYRD
jgi:hypothetical protein